MKRVRDPKRLSLQASQGEKTVVRTWILPFTAAELGKVGRYKTCLDGSGLRQGNWLRGVPGLSPRALLYAAWIGLSALDC